MVLQNLHSIEKCFSVYDDLMDEHTDIAEKQSEPSIWPWVVPLAVYMVLLVLDSRISTNPYAATHPVSNQTTIVRYSDDAEAGENDRREPVESSDVSPIKYLILTIVRVLVVGALLIFWWKIYLSQFEFSIGWAWLPVGVLGFLIWIGLCHLDLEQTILSSLGFSTDWLSSRAAFNPIDGYDNSGLLILFFVARFGLMVAVIPLAEEIFLRGFLMRYADRADWWAAPLNQLKWFVLLVAPAYAVLTHPSEAFAAIAWFSLVTWLMVRRNNIWPCVMAHATTNLLLGVYVVSFKQWQLW